MAYIASQFDEVLSPVVDDIQKERLLEFVNGDAYMFQGLPSDVFKYIQEEGRKSLDLVGPFEYHHWGITPEKFASTSIHLYYDIVALS